MTFPNFANVKKAFDNNYPSQCACNCVSTDKTAWLKKAKATTKLDVVKSMENIDINPLYTKADLSDFDNGHGKPSPHNHPTLTAGIIPNLRGHHFSMVKKICVLIVLIICASGSLEAQALEIFKCDDDKFGFKDSTGKILVECGEYQNYKSFRDGLKPVAKNDKWGFIDSTAKLVIPCIYDDIGPCFCEYDFYKDGAPLVPGFLHGRARVKKNDRWFYIDKDNNEVDCPWEDSNEVKQKYNKENYGY